MAYDPQDPLSSIIEERKKRANPSTRNLKSQITGRTPKEPEIPEAIANQPTVARGFTPNPNARMAPNQTDAPASVPAGVGPGERQIRPRPTGGTFNIPTGRTAPYGLTQANNQQILSEIAQGERQAGRQIPETKAQVSATPVVQSNSNQPKQTLSVEDQRIVNRMREGGLPESVYANNPNMLQQLKQGTMSPEYKNVVEQAARYNYNQTPAMQQAVQTTLPFQGRAGFGDVRMREQSPPLAEPGSSPGMMTRGVQQPGLGQVGVNTPTNIPTYLANDRAALAAMERMQSQAPQLSRQPFQPAQPTQQPVRPMQQPVQPTQQTVGPQRRDLTDIRDSLRAQIASEQQAMLAARRARGGMVNDGGDAEALQRIAGMRQELAQYERAATPGQPIRIKTPEENLATEQSLARQASDIMARNLGADNIPAVSGQPIRGSAEDLRRQVATMPAGPERDAMAEQLRSLQYQQQQQAARAGALPAGAVGPQPMGASVELAEQMMSEARARTQRQQEAAPRVAARQQELADVAMREGERLTGKRQDVEQQRADFARATREATLSEIGRPEREFKLNKEKFDAEIRNINSMISSRDAASQLAQKQAETERSLSERKLAAQEAQAAYNQDPNNPANIKAFAEAKQAEANAALVQAQVRNLTDKMNRGDKTQEEIAGEVAAEKATMDRIGFTEIETAALTEGLKIAGEIGGPQGTTYQGSMFTGNAEGGVKASNILLSYAQSLNKLNEINPELAKTKANLMLAQLPALMSRRLETAGPSAMAIPFGGFVGIAQMQNEQDKFRVINNFNKFYDTVNQVAGRQ